LLPLRRNFGRLAVENFASIMGLKDKVRLLKYIVPFLRIIIFGKVETYQLFITYRSNYDVAVNFGCRFTLLGGYGLSKATA